MKSQLYSLLQEHWSNIEHRLFEEEKYIKCFQLIQDEYEKMKEEGLVEDELKLGFLDKKHYLKCGKYYFDFSLEGRKKKGVMSQLKDLKKDPLLREIVYQCNCLYNYALDEMLNPVILWKELTYEAGEAVLNAKHFVDCVDKDVVDISIYKEILESSLGSCHVDNDIKTFYLVFHKFGNDRAGRFKRYYIDEKTIKYNQHSEIMIEVELNSPKTIKSYLTQRKEETFEEKE